MVFKNESSISEKLPSKPNNRRYYLDFLRIIACFFVIFNHTKGYTAYLESENIFEAFYLMVYTMFTRINVPIFLMISGILLLPLKTGYKELFTKRIARIVAVLFCSSFVLYYVVNTINGCPLDAGVFFRAFLDGTHTEVYWYLYAYLGFLLTLPLLQRAAKGFSHGDFIMLILLHAVFSTFMPFINYFVGLFGVDLIRLSGHFSVPLMTIKAFFYPLMGYYLEYVFDISKINRKNVWLLPVIIITSILIESAITYHEGINYGYTQNFVQLFDYVLAGTVFVLVKYLFTANKTIKSPRFMHKAFAFISSLTLGIYVMDPVLKVTTRFFEMVITTSDPIVYSIVWCFYSMIACGLMTFILKKLPIIKKLL